MAKQVSVWLEPQHLRVGQAIRLPNTHKRRIVRQVASATDLFGEVEHHVATTQGEVIPVRKGGKIETLDSVIPPSYLPQDTIEELARDIEPRLETVPLDKVLSNQRDIRPQTLARYRESFWQTGGHRDYPPDALEAQGYYHVRDGNHRINAAMLEGAQQMGMMVRHAE